MRAIAGLAAAGVMALCGCAPSLDRPQETDSPPASTPAVAPTPQSTGAATSPEEAARSRAEAFLSSRVEQLGAATHYVRWDEPVLPSYEFAASTPRLKVVASCFAEDSGQLVTVTLSQGGNQLTRLRFGCDPTGEKAGEIEPYDFTKDGSVRVDVSDPASIVLSVLGLSG